MFLSTLYHYFFGNRGDSIKSRAIINKFPSILYKYKEEAKLSILSKFCSISNVARFGSLSFKNQFSDLFSANKYCVISETHKTGTVVIKNV